MKFKIIFAAVLVAALAAPATSHAWFSWLGRGMRTTERTMFPGNTPPPAPAPAPRPAAQKPAVKSTLIQGPVDSIGKGEMKVKFQRGKYRIATLDTTQITDRNGKTIQFADIKVGHEVEVSARRVWTLFFADTIVDKSLPEVRN